MALRRKALIDAADAIRRANSVVLSGHVNPDGDCLGSVLAVDWALRGLGKKSTPLSIDGVPETLLFLPGAERFVETTSDRDFDLAVLCDLEGIKRIGKNRDVVTHAKRVLVIDHHVPWEQLGDVRLIDHDSPATAAIVFRLLRELGVPISPEIATCLLAGIVTDTGSFRFRNTSPRALRIAAELMTHGADIGEINEQVYENRSIEALKLHGLALASIQANRSGDVVWAKLSQGDFRDANATDEQSEGIVNQVRSVRDALVVALLREVGPSRVRISLRGRDPADVALIAQQFGGGGHRLAAGCSIDAPLAQAEPELIAAIEQWIDSSLSTSRKA